MGLFRVFVEDEDYEFGIIFEKNLTKKYELQNIRPFGHNLVIRAFSFIFFNDNNMKFVVFAGQKYTNDMSIKVVFDVNHKSAIIFVINIWVKNKICEIRVHFGM